MSHCLLPQERSLRESNDTRRSANITELVVLKDREKQLKFELEQAQEQLRREQGRVKHYMEQVRDIFTLLCQMLLDDNWHGVSQLYESPSLSSAAAGQTGTGQHQCWAECQHSTQ